MSEDLFTKALQNPDEKVDGHLSDDIRIESKSENITKLEEKLDNATDQENDNVSVEESPTFNSKLHENDHGLETEQSDEKTENTEVTLNKDETTISSTNRGEIEQNITSSAEKPTEDQQQEVSDHSQEDSNTNLNEDSDTSSLDSSSSQSSSSSSSDEEDINVDVENESDLEDNGTSAPIVSKNEVLEDQTADLPESYVIDEKTNISSIGTVKSVLDNNLIITADISGEKRVLEEGSIFCLEDRTPLGVLREVFGPLQAPFYRVGVSESYKKNNDLKSLIGIKVFIVLKDVHWIDTFQIKMIKGTDASNMFDEELPEEEQEFSDDEKEAMYKKQKKQKKRKPEKTGRADTNDSNTKKVRSDNFPVVQKMRPPIGMSRPKNYTSRSSREKTKILDYDDGNASIRSHAVDQSKGVQVSQLQPSINLPSTSSYIPPNDGNFHNPSGFPTGSPTGFIPNMPQNQFIPPVFPYPTNFNPQYSQYNAPPMQGSFPNFQPQPMSSQGMYPPPTNNGYPYLPNMPFNGQQQFQNQQQIMQQNPQSYQSSQQAYQLHQLLMQQQQSPHHTEQNQGQSNSPTNQGNQSFFHQ